MNKFTQPPRLFLRFFRWFCHPELRDPIEGDLMELYAERKDRSGMRNADLKFIIDVLLLLRPGIIRSPERNHDSNTFGMYRSYFMIGWRSLLKNKGYSYINSIGLSVGMAVTMLIGIWIFDELSFNRNHDNYDRIAEVFQHRTVNNVIQTSAAPVPLANELRASFGNDFKHVVRMWWQTNHTLAIGDLKIPRVGTFLEAGGLEMFTLLVAKPARTGLHRLV